MRSHSMNYSPGKYSRRFTFLFVWFGLLLAPNVLAQDAWTPTNPLTLDLVQTDNSSGGAALDGFVTNDLLVNNEGRLLGFQMFLFLEEGTIYQDPLGTHLPPTQIAVEAVAPSLAYDTFLAMGSPYANGPHGVYGPFGKAIDVRPGGSSGGSPIMNDQAIDVAWSTVGGDVVSDVEDFLLSRVTLSDDARGYWTFLASAASSPQISSIYHATVGKYNYPEGLGVVEDGVMDFTADIHYSPIGNHLPSIPRFPTAIPKEKSNPPRSDPALGKSLSIVQRDNSSGGPSLEGFVTNDLILDTEDQLTIFELYLVLEQGQIYQDPVGGNTAPADGLADRGFPALEFDTFVAVGADTAAGPYGTPGIAGGAVDFGAPPKVEFDDDTLSIAWYGTPGVPMFGAEDFLLSRISLSDDAIGSWELLVGKGGRLDHAKGTIENGLLLDSWNDSQANKGGSSSNAGGQQSQQDRFGQSNSEVPEPTTCVLTLSALSLLLHRRQRGSTKVPSLIV